tara:strand:- start:3713 stop:3991 length:279 start_codon:yes stop_codon:yes gene_type:complete
MQELNFTQHAKKRCQQRGIPISVVEFIIENGDSIRTHNDKKHFINKSRLKKFERSEKDFVKKHDKHILNTAVVTNNFHVITCMKKNKKIKWN